MTIGTASTPACTRPFPDPEVTSGRREYRTMEGAGSHCVHPRIDAEHGPRPGPAAPLRGPRRQRADGRRGFIDPEAGWWRVPSAASREYRPRRATTMAMEKVLVTGGAGFIGSLLVSRLSQEDVEVRVVDVLHPQVHQAGDPRAFPIRSSSSLSTWRMGRPGTRSSRFSSQTRWCTWLRRPAQANPCWKQRGTGR